MNRKESLPKLALVVWMGACAVLFLLLMIPPEGVIAALLPDWLLTARALLLPYFYSPSDTG